MLIIGTGALASDILSSLQYDDYTEEIVFYHGGSVPPKQYILDNFRVFTTMEECKRFFNEKGRMFICSVGENVAREKLTITFEAIGGINNTYISSRSLVGKYAHVHPRGVIVMHHAVIGNDCHIGEGSVVYVNASLGHDSIIGRYVLVSGQVCMSNVQIGEYTFIGLGAVFKPGVKVGKHVQVGTGAVVVKDVADCKIIAGNPAQVMGENKIA